MTPIGQLLLRNRGGLSKESSLLWVNPVPDDCWQQLQQEGVDLSLLSQNYSHWGTLSGAGATCRFDTFPDPEISYDHVILTLPHSKARLQMMLECTRNVLRENGKLWLVGENKGGIRSAGKGLENYYNEATKLDSARHCSLFEARRPGLRDIFDQSDYKTNWTLEVAGKTLKICSWPGVFAHGRSDPGTLMLLQALPALAPFGSVLDFGCGSGVISAAMASIDPTAMFTMTDVDAMALHSAGQTMLHNGIDANIKPKDGLKGLGEKYDLIVSNPPFHQGNKTDSRLSMKLLDSVRNFLHENGSLVMVVNRHIPYRKWLDGQFGEHRVLMEDSVYQVLQAN